MIREAWETALGRTHRRDEVAPHTGGTAGNSALSAWTGLLLLVLFAAEGLTLLSVRGLLTWHVAIGALIIPPLMVKIGSTGWRMISYYTRRAAYVRSGPPPMLLRLVGPLVVVTTLALLASGVVLILIGQTRGRGSLISVAGFHLDWVFLHKAIFFAWFGVMTLHVLGRVIPALKIVDERRRNPRAVPGISMRLVTLLGSVALGVVLAIALVRADSSWHQDLGHDVEGAPAHTASS